MTRVKFYDSADDNLLKFAVIVAKSNGKWVFCKHKERDTQPSVNYTKKPEQLKSK